MNQPANTPAAAAPTPRTLDRVLMERQAADPGLVDALMLVIDAIQTFPPESGDALGAYEVTLGALLADDAPSAESVIAYAVGVTDAEPDWKGAEEVTR